MRIQMRRLVKTLSLLLLAFLLTIASCKQPKISETTDEISQSLDSTECRLIRHEMGETCIPIQPRRIIALSSSVIPDSLLALGIKPIAVTYVSHFDRKIFHGLSADDIDGIELVGTNEQPSLEKILELNPDLILAPMRNGASMYEQLQNIAPTVIIDVDELTFSPHENFLTIAEILDRKNEAELVIEHYQEQVKTVKKLLGEQLEAVEVAFIVYNGGEFYVPARSATFFEVLSDVGVRINPVFMERNQWVPISIEVISEYDSDILFILNPDNKSVSFFLQNPLIAQLKSVKNNQAYVVDVINWVPYGPLGMSKLLDEFPKYLLQANELP